MVIATAAESLTPTPRRSAVLHAWVAADIKEIYERRAAELGLHVDDLVARLLTNGAIDFERAQRKREK